MHEGKNITKTSALNGTAIVVTQAGVELFRTQMQYKTFDPVWKESFTRPLSELQEATLLLAAIEERKDENNKQVCDLKTIE